MSKKKKSYPTEISQSYPFTVNGKLVGHMVYTKIMTAEDAWDMRIFRKLFQDNIKIESKWKTPTFKKGK